MRSVNKVILIGNLTRDPEMRQTPNGQQVATFGIATNREWVTKDGMRHTSSEYHEIVAWSRLADICGKYLKKGKLVYIEGYLKTRSWDTPEGIKKFKTEIVIQDMIMLDKRPTNTTDEYIPDEIMETNNAPEEEIGVTPTSKAESGVSRAPKRIRTKLDASSGRSNDLTSQRFGLEENMKTEDETTMTGAGNAHNTDIDADLGL